MKTRHIPAIIMLIAGLIDSIISILSRADLMSFTKRLLLVLVIFYILGIGVKIVLDKTFPIMDDKKEQDTDSSENEEVSEEEQLDDLENIDTDSAEETEKVGDL